MLLFHRFNLFPTGANSQVPRKPTSKTRAQARAEKSVTAGFTVEKEPEGKDAGKEPTKDEGSRSPAKARSRARTRNDRNQKPLITFEKGISIATLMISILVAYHIYFMQRPAKALEIVLTDYQHLRDVKNNSIVGTLILNGETLSGDLYYVAAKVVNSGNQPIEESDFRTPLVFTLPPNATVLKAVVDRSYPDGINAQITFDQNTVTLSPLLLNPDDQVVIQFSVAVAVTVKNKDEDPLPLTTFKPTARIKGISNIRFSNRTPE
jgi:hypothetical protein